MSLAASVKDRFVGKGIVVSGGTAALDSAIEKKFAKKQKAEQSEILATELAAVCNVNLNVAPAQNPVAAANAAPMDIEASNSGPARQ